MMTRNIWSMFSAALVFHSCRPFAVNSRRSIAFVRFVTSVDILLPAQLLFAPGIILRYMYIYYSCLPGFALRFIKNARTWFDGHDPHTLTFSILVYTPEYFYFQDKTLKLSGKNITGTKQGKLANQISPRDMTSSRVNYPFQMGLILTIVWTLF